VRIERLTIDAFGKLGDFDTGPQPLGPLVVVLGPNEAGKSTLFSFLTTALYGFQPASRERNPHVPWDMDEASGEIRIRLADDGCASVSRKLRSSPSGRLSLGSSTRELRNQPVPWVEHVPRTVFRQVFAITLSELAGLDEDTWARIQDRVLGAMGATDLRPARAVAESLEREASEIWRPNRRGNQRLRDIQDEIRALRGRRMEALERDRIVRQRVEESEAVRHTLRELRTERSRDELVLGRIQELLPIKRRLDRIASLRASGGPRDELEELPADLADALKRLATERRQLTQQIAEVDDDRQAPEERIVAYGGDARALQSARPAIDTLTRGVARLGSSGQDVADLQAEARELEVQLRTTSSQLLEVDEPTAADGTTAPSELDAAYDAVRSLSIDILRDRVHRAEVARSEVARAATERATSERESARTEGGRADGSSGALPAVAALVAGGVGLGWGLLGGPGVATTVGSALLAVGVTLLLLGGRRHTPAEETPTKEDPHADQLRALEAEIERTLADIPVRATFLTPAGAALVATVERLQAVLARWDENVERIAEQSRRAATLEAEARRVAALLGVVLDAEPAEFALRLERGLADADRAEEAARAAEGEVTRLDRRRQRLEERRAEVEAVEASLREAAARAAPQDEDPVTAVEHRMDAHASADRMLAELEHARPDLPEVRARIAEAESRGESWVMADADLADRRTRLIEVQDRIEECVGRAEALDTEIAHLRGQETVDAIDGEILSLQEDERSLTARRDRTWLMAQLLREADRRFREEHQPDLLRRASGYLERLTDGRYSRILVDELGDGDLFQLVGPGLPRPVPLARPISTGTLEQAYLSLRLAIVDHLDRGKERLPLFIDEALVNWDAARRSRGLEVLAELSQSRQVFSFTCHPEMAEQLESLGARVLRIDR